MSFIAEKPKSKNYEISSSNSNKFNNEVNHSVHSISYICEKPKQKNNNFVISSSSNNNQQDSTQISYIANNQKINNIQQKTFSNISSSHTNNISFNAPQKRNYTLTSNSISYNNNMEKKK